MTWKNTKQLKNAALLSKSMKLNSKLTLWSATFIQLCSLMPKPLYKTNNWKQYNHALINRGSLTFWIDEEAIIEWKQGKRGKTRIFSDLAITTALMLKRIFSMPLHASQGFMDSESRLAQLPLRSPHYSCISCISRRAKDVDVSFRTKTKWPIQHLAIDATGLKVYSEGEWKVKKHGTDGKRRVWWKLHLAVDTSTHENYCRRVEFING